MSLKYFIRVSIDCWYVYFSFFNLLFPDGGIPDLGSGYWGKGVKNRNPYRYIYLLYLYG